MLRNSDRIPQILELVGEVWERYPDQRLGQLLLNACRDLPGWPDIFSVEDRVLARRLERMQKSAGLHVQLRAVLASDLPVFFQHQQDSVASHMAAFTHKDPSDSEAFEAHWARILRDPTIVTRTILASGAVVGHAASWVQAGVREITYWLGRDSWGMGVATKAVREFVGLVEERPLFARVAKDNLGSIRVLEKCGFSVSGSDRGFANARGQEIDELVLELRSLA